MINKENKDIKSITKGAETIIVSTEKGICIKGDTRCLLTCYALITREMAKLNGMTKEMLDEAYNVSYKSKEELIEELLKKMKKHKEKK